MTTPADVTFVKNAIHRKDEPRHFMRIKQTSQLVTASWQGKTLAQSRDVLTMQEAGFDLYDPVYYFPKKAIPEGLLEKAELSTHCPLKGDTEYFHININGQKVENAAFCYAYPNMEETELLKDYVAFDQSRIQIFTYLNTEE